MLGPHENQYNWRGLEFSVSIKKINKFEKNSPGMAVNVLFNNMKNQKKIMYKVHRSRLKRKCKKQVTLLMIEDGERRHTAIKNISRHLSKLNGKIKHTYHYCMNCHNGFHTGLARDKLYVYCSNSGHIKVNMPNEK